MSDRTLFQGDEVSSTPCPEGADKNCKEKKNVLVLPIVIKLVFVDFGGVMPRI